MLIQENLSIPVDKKWLSSRIFGFVPRLYEALCFCEEHEIYETEFINELDTYIEQDYCTCEWIQKVIDSFINSFITEYISYANIESLKGVIREIENLIETTKLLNTVYKLRPNMSDFIDRLKEEKKILLGTQKYEEIDAMDRRIEYEESLQMLLDNLWEEIHQEDPGHIDNIVRDYVESDHCTYWGFTKLLDDILQKDAYPHEAARIYNKHWLQEWYIKYHCLRDIKELFKELYFDAGWYEIRNAKDIEMEIDVQFINYFKNNEYNTAETLEEYISLFIMHNKGIDGDDERIHDIVKLYRKYKATITKDQNVLEEIQKDAEYASDFESAFFVTNIIQKSVSNRE